MNSERCLYSTTSRPLRRFFNFPALALFILLGLGLHSGPSQGFIFSVPDDHEVHNPMGSYSQEELDPSSIRLLVWNVYKGKEDGWRKDYREMIQQQDILVLQEMFLDNQMNKTFKNSTTFGYETATSFIYDSDDVRTGVATASRVEPKRLIWRRSPGREPVIHTPKMGLITVYPLERTEQDLMVINIHAINFVGTNTLREQLKDLAKQAKDFQGPLIFAGDFNTWTPSKVAAMYNVMRKLRLKEVEFPHHDDRKEIFGNYIDYIFVRDLGVQYSQTHGEVESSDHVAMSAELFVEPKNFEDTEVAEREPAQNSLVAAKEAIPQSSSL